MKIDVIMTTHDRVELLRQTVESYLAAEPRPERLFVFDDNSINRVGVTGGLSLNNNVGIDFHRTFGDRNDLLPSWLGSFGAHKMTPYALRHMFTEHNSEAVFILDSDTKFHPKWWAFTEEAGRYFDRDTNFGVFSLFNDRNFSSFDCGSIAWRSKQGIGAFGSLITRSYWERFIVPLEDKGYSNWDYQASRAAADAGLKVYVSNPSFLQHTGIKEGTHIGSTTPSVALDFGVSDPAVKPDIIIPTCRPIDYMQAQIRDIEANSPECRVIPTCIENASASQNRNAGLDRATSPIVIMVDDDTRGFYPGWWKPLVAPLLNCEYVAMTSARLVTPDGGHATMNGSKYHLDIDYEVVEHMPSACIAFRRDTTRFDERFRRSGFEDTWFCDCLRKERPHGQFLIVNSCRIIHLNEMKGQQEALSHNCWLYSQLKMGALQ